MVTNGDISIIPWGFLKTDIGQHCAGACLDLYVLGPQSCSLDCFCRRHHDGTHNGAGPGLFQVLSGLVVQWCVTDCECNTGDLALVSTQPTLMELKLWLRTVTSIDFWVFKVWPVVTGCELIQRSGSPR